MDIYSIWAKSKNNSLSKAKEIMEQEEKFIAQGGKFLHPMPMPHFLN